MDWRKIFLSLDEIVVLSKTKCNNDQVKRAFFFSLNTGSDFVMWKSWPGKIFDNEKIRFTQVRHKTPPRQQTSPLISIKLLLTWLGNRGKPDELVFILPSHTGCLQSLKTWVKNAKIEKHITWHCARHSIAVNLLDNGTDVKTVASVLGHSGLAHVNKYLRVIDERKKQQLTGCQK